MFLSERLPCKGSIAALDGRSSLGYSSRNSFTFTTSYDRYCFGGRNGTFVRNLLDMVPNRIAASIDIHIQLRISDARDLS